MIKLRIPKLIAAAAIVGFGSLFLNSAASAKKLSQEFWQQAANIKSPGMFPTVNQYAGQNIMLDGTPYLLALTSKDIEVPEFFKPLLNRPILTNSYDSPGGHFKIHYNVTGDSAIVDPGVDDDPADGIPDYINRVAETADHVWAFEIDTLGYNAPVSDGWYPDGGDSLYDIYIIDQAEGYFGYTQPEQTNSEIYPRYTSYLVLDNDYSFAYWMTPLNALRVTTAHEFFHAIQMGGYDATEHDNGRTTWWYEATAVWMEDQVYDYINDYLNYLPYYFNYPAMSLENTEGQIGYAHQYASCVWPIYLGERFDIDIIRRIWTECATIPGYNLIPSMDTAIIAASDDSLNLDKAFAEFATWNYFTGSRANSSNQDLTYSEANTWPKIPDSLMAQITNISEVRHDIPAGNEIPYGPSFLAANYVRFVVNSEPPGGLDVDFNGDTDVSWATALLGTNDSTNAITPNIKYFFISDQGSGNQVMRNWTKYSHVVMIPCAVGNHQYSFEPHYGYSWQYSDTLTGIDPTATGTIVYQSFPNPFKIVTGHESVTFPFELTKLARPKIKIYTVSGELVREIEPSSTGKLPPGIYDNQLSWDGRNEMGGVVAGGVYIYQFYTDSGSEVKKLMVIR